MSSSNRCTTNNNDPNPSTSPSLEQSKDHNTTIGRRRLSKIDTATRYETLEREYVQLKFEVAQLEANRDEHELLSTKSQKVQDDLQLELKQQQQQNENYKVRLLKLHEERTQLEEQTSDIQNELMKLQQYYSHQVLKQHDKLERKTKSLFEDYEKVEMESEKDMQMIQAYQAGKSSKKQVQTQQRLQQAKLYVKELQSAIQDIQQEVLEALHEKEATEQLEKQDGSDTDFQAKKEQLLKGPMTDILSSFQFQSDRTSTNSKSKSSSSVTLTSAIDGIHAKTDTTGNVSNKPIRSKQAKQNISKKKENSSLVLESHLSNENNAEEVVGAYGSTFITSQSNDDDS